MKNGNCGSCPHLHRCRATNNDECIDTILGRKHYMSNREKQIRADAIKECIKFVDEWDSVIADALAKEFKEQNNECKSKFGIVEVLI